MSKGKRAKFHLKSGETVLKKGMMDYSVSGKYRHFIAGDAILTDSRFYFGAQLETGEYFCFEFLLKDVYTVEKIGVPFFTRSLLVTTDSRQYRLNAFFVGRWMKPLKKAVEAVKEKE